MKHFNLFFLILFISISANSQTKISVNGGFLVGNSRWAQNGTKIGYNSLKPGFKLGLGFNVPVSFRVNLEPQINFVSKGVIISHPGGMIITGGGSFYSELLKQTMTIRTAEIPLNIYLNYKIANSKNLFFIGGGPVIGIGIDGIIKEKALVRTSIPTPMNQTVIAKKKIVFDGFKPSAIGRNTQDFHLNPFELGANITAGVEFKKQYIIKVMYNQTFSDIDPNENVSFRPNYFGFSFGLYLKKHKSLLKTHK